jgi:hypothetical protein
MTALQISRTCGPSPSPVLVGAHLLLQSRVEVLNGDGRATLPALIRRMERTCRDKGGFASGFYWSRAARGSGSSALPLLLVHPSDQGLAPGLAGRKPVNLWIQKPANSQNRKYGSP